MWVCTRDLIRNLSTECEGKYEDCTDCVLNKIKAEIEHEREEAYTMLGHELGFDKIAAYDKCIGIIDKYRTESEET